MKPITPNEVGEKHEEQLPEFVIRIVNQCIAQAWNGRQAEVLQSEIVDRIVSEMELSDRATVFEKGYLHIEDAYRRAGWKVEYDRPGYNESYPAKFVFSHRTRG